jgi:hypothetical protein
VLSSVPRLELYLWAMSTLVALILFSLIFVRRLDREFPFLTAYLGVNLVQTVAQVFVYQFYGFASDVTYASVWASQAVVVVARSLATGEFCFRVLGHYRGIWAMAIRILLICASGVLGLSLYFGKDGFHYGVVTLEMASEAFIATLVVGTFLFVRHYDAMLERSAMLLGLGLGLNSCLKILNDAVLSRYYSVYARVWNDIGMVTFSGVLVLWIFAMRAVGTVPVPQPELQPLEVYRLLAPQMNRRLAELNQKLTRLWKLEHPKS